MVYIVTFSCVNIQVQVQIYFQNQSVNKIEFSINLSYNTFTNKSNKHSKYNDVNNFTNLLENGGSRIVHF